MLIEINGYQIDPWSIVRIHQLSQKAIDTLNKKRASIGIRHEVETAVLFKRPFIGNSKVHMFPYEKAMLQQMIDEAIYYELEMEHTKKEVPIEVRDDEILLRLRPSREHYALCEHGGWDFADIVQSCMEEDRWEVIARPD